MKSHSNSTQLQIKFFVQYTVGDIMIGCNSSIIFNYHNIFTIVMCMLPWYYFNIGTLDFTDHELALGQQAWWSVAAELHVEGCMLVPKVAFCHFIYYHIWCSVVSYSEDKQKAPYMYVDRPKLIIFEKILASVIDTRR